jgi:hypothetical protein
VSCLWQDEHCNGGSSNGRTAPSEGVYLGSNPGPPANLSRVLGVQGASNKPEGLSAPAILDIMNKKTVGIILVILILFAGIVSVVGYRTRDLSNPDAVAYVNNVPILKADLDFYTNNYLEFISSMGSSTTPQEARTLALRGLIRKEVLLQAGRKKGISISDSELREQAQAMQVASEQAENYKEYMEYIAAHGYKTPDVNDPIYLQSLRKDYLRSQAEQIIIQEMSRSAQDSPRPVDAAIEEFIQKSGFKIRIVEK